jgi:hypothetical protein
MEFKLNIHSRTQHRPLSYFAMGGLWHGNMNTMVLKEARKFPKEVFPTT